MRRCGEGRENIAFGLMKRDKLPAAQSGRTRRRDLKLVQLGKFAQRKAAPAIGRPAAARGARAQTREKPPLLRLARRWAR